MLEAIFAAPALVKVLGSLAIILFANLLRTPLLIAILIGALVLAGWTGHPLGEIALLAGQALIAPSNLLLLAVLYLVIGLSNQMDAAGSMRDLVDAVRRRFSHRTAIATLPAMIGFLPMPGGAIFSAPLVDGCDPDGVILPDLKTQINYWFRHIWEYWWPMYPGVLLAMEKTGLATWQVMLYGLPLTLASVAVGHVFLLRRLHPAEAIGEEEDAPRASLLVLLTPILVVVAGYTLVRLGHAALAHAVPTLPVMSDFIPMGAGVLAAMLVLQRQRPQPRATWKKLLFSPKTFTMAGIIAAMQVYSAFINAHLPGGATLMGVMDTELHAWGIPLWAVFVIIPFISGLTMGVAFGFVGASFPIVVSLLGPDPTFGTLLSTAALAYGFGYLGMMLSPVHVCLIVTNEHFNTRLHRTLPPLALPAACIAVVVVAVHMALKVLVK
jgi:integral membrane protein (TIGR00529 family)